MTVQERRSRFTQLKAKNKNSNDKPNVRTSNQPFAFPNQYATFCSVKGDLLEAKRRPFATHWGSTGYAGG